MSKLRKGSNLERLTEALEQAQADEFAERLLRNQKRVNNDKAE